MPNVCNIAHTVHYKSSKYSRQQAEAFRMVSVAGVLIDWSGLFFLGAIPDEKAKSNRSRTTSDQYRNSTIHFPQIRIEPAKNGLPTFSQLAKSSLTLG